MNENQLHPVLITGAGPGDPDLLTVKAYEAIRSADILLYDCMPARYVLDIIREDAEVVYLCKNHEAPEDELKSHTLNVIDHLEKFYYEGKKVVRLKAGDAFMFGGGGHETELLTSRNIPFDVLPGLTAGAAAANLYGVKISEKDESDLVMYYIGFSIKDNFNQVRQIANLLHSGGTLILYMADDNLKDITSVLKSEGVPGTMPTVVVGMASLPDEDCVSATLDTITEETDKKVMLMPFTYFIGKHVKATIRTREKMLSKSLLLHEETF
jgi:uroporphyrin-III C-methyltransferase